MNVCMYEVCVCMFAYMYMYMVLWVFTEPLISCLYLGELTCWHVPRLSKLV